MRILAFFLASLAAHVATAQTPSSTPSLDDIPQPIALEWGAGDSAPGIAHFLNIRTAVGPTLSPNGRELAFRSNITGSQQVWTVGSDSGWPRQLTFVETATFHAWSPRGDWILYGADTAGDEREGYFLVSPDGLKRRELLAASDAFRVFGGFTKDGGQIAYATTVGESDAFDVHLMNVDTGEDRKIFEGRPGLAVAAVRPDARAMILMEARGEDANALYSLDVESGELTTLFDPPERSAYLSAAWQPDGRAFYLVTDHEREYRGLARYDVARRALEWLETPEADVEQVALSHDGKYLAWIVNDGGYSTMHLRDLARGADLATPPLPRGVYELQWAADAPVAAIAVTGPQTPGDIWTYDAATGRTARATESSAGGVDLSSLPLPEHHSFASLDGVTIHGLLYAPAGVPPGQRAPVVLAVHGGPTLQARPDFLRSNQYLYKYLQSRGFAIFDLNFRGSTGYGKTFARLNDRRLRANELLDLEAAVQWLGRQPGIDASRVAIAGGSYGGYLAMAAVGRLPNVFSAAVASVGVSNWVTALEGASPLLRASDRYEYGDIEDAADREYFATLSPLTYAAQARTPIMVQHGANDTRDPVEESDQFVRALREHGVAVEYLRFPDEGHEVRKLSNRLIAYSRIAAFLERTLER